MGGWRIVVIPSRRKGCFLSSPSRTPIQRDPTSETRAGIPRSLSRVPCPPSRFCPILHVPLDRSTFIITRSVPDYSFLRNVRSWPRKRSSLASATEIKAGVNRSPTRVFPRLFSFRLSSFRIELFNPSLLERLGIISMSILISLLKEGNNTNCEMDLRYNSARENTFARNVRKKKRKKENRVIK